jgi:hypothetical protein
MGKVIGCILVIPLIGAIAALVWWLFQVLFNVVSPIFGGPTLTFWQAAAICVLGGIIGGWFKRSASSK